MKRLTVPRARFVLWGVLSVLAVGVIAPFLNADGFRGRVRSALERALQRKVDVGEVRLNLLTGPGFSVSKVTIHEDPSVGLEPFAYVTRLDARVNLWKILAGRFEFSNLRLSGPLSVNLAHSEGKPWNIAPLLKRAAGASIPHIQVSDGRINFRSGERKSVYYVSRADLSLSPAADGFDVSFSGEPARTDRSARGFGRFTGNLRWRPAQPIGGQVLLNVELEPSAIAEVTMLLQGRDAGLHGLVASRARMEGSPESLRIEGEARIEDVHRWDLMAEHGRGWELPYKGLLDLEAGTLDLSTPAVADGGVQLRVRASGIFTKPHGAAHLALRNTPAAPLLSAARHVGLRVPEAAAASGEAFGVVSYSFKGGIEGRVRFTEAVLNLSDAPPVRFERADVVLKGGRLELAPALAEVGENRATLEGSYDPAVGGVEMRISTKELGIDQFRQELSKFLGSARIPVLAHARGGFWSGSLKYRVAADVPAAWSGSIQVRSTAVDVDGIAAPVLIQAASVKVDGARLHITDLEGEVGDLLFAGDYRYEPALARPHSFRLRMPELSAAQVERIMAPAFNRPRGFIARTLRLNPGSVPPWLSGRRAAGSLEIDSFTVAGTHLENVRARILWDGAEIELSDAEGRWNDSSVWLSGSISLAARSPEYRLHWRLGNFAWNGGRIDIDGLVRTSGTGIEVLDAMSAEGTFNGRSITLQSESVRAFSGCYNLVLDRGLPRLKLSGVQATLGQEYFSGDGGTQPDGRLHMELAGARTFLRLTGTAWPFELDGFAQTR